MPPSIYTYRSVMAIPLLAYPLTTQSGRVSNLAGDASTTQAQSYGSTCSGDDTSAPRWMR